MTIAPVLRPIAATPAVFTEQESRVRSYGRSFPAVFGRAEGCRLYDEHGRSWLDFLAGAGSLNYGHNHPVLRDALVDYIQAGGIAHGLDLQTTAKANFLEAFEELVLKPRGLDHVVQFTGPTGANAVEAALKIARKVTGRSSVVTFTNGFHGVTLGALAMTGNAHHRGGAGVELPGAVRMPYEGYLGPDIDTLGYLDKALGDPSSGIELPAAAIVETVQGEGGLNVASAGWLRQLAALCRRHGMLLIVDDIQAGCGRTGSFFSFDAAGIQPDLVTLSKSLSGMGLPFAVTLIRRDLDVWEPGEHNGTFRGNNHAFVTATTALRHFWSDDAFGAEVRRKAELLGERLRAISARHPGRLRAKGRGLMQGLSFRDPAHATAVSRLAFRRGLVIETGGPRDEVLKCLCPLVIEDHELHQGLDVIEEAVAERLAADRRTAKVAPGRRS